MMKAIRKTAVTVAASLTSAAITYAAHDNAINTLAFVVMVTMVFALLSLSCEE